MAEEGRPFHRPKCVGFGADGISDASRRLIEETFGIPVFSSYNAVEAWRLGFECEPPIETGLARAAFAGDEADLALAGDGALEKAVQPCQLAFPRHEDRVHASLRFSPGRQVTGDLRPVNVRPRRESTIACPATGVVQ